MSVKKVIDASPREFQSYCIQSDEKQKNLSKETYSKRVETVKARLTEALSGLDKRNVNPYAPQILYLMNVYNGLARRLIRDYGAQHVTNAWLKMYEILCQMKIVEDIQKRLAKDEAKEITINVFLGAELPGAFILAFNHYMKTKHPKVPFDWLASSYVSGDEKTLGDRYGVLRENRDKWIVDLPDERKKEHYANGDVTDIANLLEQVKRCHGRRIDLYTSDIGTNVSEDYLDQEGLTSLLNFGQIIFGLMILSKGGIMITKQFTYFSNFSISLIALLTDLFETLCIVKPLTSKSANSEVYIVGKGFKGTSESLIESLLSKLKECKEKGQMATKIDSLIPFKGIDEKLIESTEIIHARYQADLLDICTVLAEKYKKNTKRLEEVFREYYGKFEDNWIADNPIRQLKVSDRIKCSN